MQIGQFGTYIENSFNSPLYPQLPRNQGETGPQYRVPVTIPSAGDFTVVVEMVRTCHLKLITIW